jgi:DmsE family decaheme c-type cytochrome
LARAADDDAAVAARKALRSGGHAGSDVCGACHTTSYRHEQRIVHGRRLLSFERRGKARNCEGCHGPAKAHAEDPIGGPKMPDIGTETPERFNAMCLQCHDKRLRKHEWRRSEHNTGRIHCYQCHNLAKGTGSTHLAKDEPDLCLDCHRGMRAKFALNSHHPVIREGRMRCSDCHDVHEQQALPVGDSERIRRQCTQCHKQQRGPYIFEHGAISGGLSDGCLDCHQPHASPNRDLLKITGRGLCLSCHPDRIGHFPGQDCIQCHRGFHGSNSDPSLLDP